MIIKDNDNESVQQSEIILGIYQHSHMFCSWGQQFCG